MDIIALLKIILLKLNSYNILVIYVQTGKRIGVLLLIFLLSLASEFTFLKQYIGYQVLKNHIEKDYNVFQLAYRFFGQDLFVFYSQDLTVDSEVIKEYQQDGLTHIFQNEEALVLNDYGIVSKISKNSNGYEVTIKHLNMIKTYGGLAEVLVSVYQKVDNETVVGWLEYIEVGYYYYSY